MKISLLMNTFFTCVIAFLGVYVWFQLYRKNKGFMQINADLCNGIVVEKKRKAYETKLNYDKGARIEKATTTEEKESFDLDQINNTKEEFFNLYSDYVSWSQMIPIFPLLGILGTVLGLVQGFWQDDVEMAVTRLVDGLGTALFTTIAGLIVAIILKIVDARGPGRMVNRIEGELAVIDGKIHIKTLTDELREAKEALQERAHSSVH